MSNSTAPAASAQARVPATPTTPIKRVLRNEDGRLLDGVRDAKGEFFPTAPMPRPDDGDRDGRYAAARAKSMSRLDRDLLDTADQLDSDWPVLLAETDLNARRVRRLTSILRLASKKLTVLKREIDQEVRNAPLKTT